MPTTLGSLLDDPDDRCAYVHRVGDVHSIRSRSSDGLRLYTWLESLGQAVSAPLLVCACSTPNGGSRSR
jgi:hypothetical protein